MRVTNYSGRVHSVSLVSLSSVNPNLTCQQSSIALTNLLAQTPNSES